MAVAATVAFFRIEARQPHPVVPLSLFRNVTVAVTVAAGAAVSVAFYSMVFVFSLFFQQVQGRSASSRAATAPGWPCWWGRA